ncbi:MAG: proteasome accessory factor PafA2 family protein [Planctomycetota bacterium]
MIAHNEESIHVPKVVGCDTELANYVTGPGLPSNTCNLAAEAIVAEVDGVANRGAGAWNSGYASNNPQDRARHFLRNGGCIYIDLAHTEICSPEVLSAWDFVMYQRALLELVRESRERAQEFISDGQELRAAVYNSDGMGQAWGNHISCLITRRCFEDLFDRRVQHALALASFHASSIVWGGQGKVGAENGQPDCDYQLSQRADHFVKLIGLQTTFDRPICNTRDEPLAGLGGNMSGLARLHCIVNDAGLCQHATLLKAGTLQVMANFLESEQPGPEVMLADPVEAMIAWSHDPTLRRKCQLIDGSEISAVDLQLRFCDLLHEHVDAGECDDTVIGARGIMAMYRQTLEMLRDTRSEDDLVHGPLSSRLDWVLKARILQHAREQYPAIDRAQLKHLDCLYGDLDPRYGLFWAFERTGHVDMPVTKDAIARARYQAPGETRAYSRARIIDELGAYVTFADWDRVKITLPTGLGRVGYGRSSWQVELADPLGFTSRDTAAIFDESASIGEIVERLCAMGDQRSLVDGDAPESTASSN